MGGTLLRHLLQTEHCVTLSPGCCRMPANHGRTRHRANFGGAQQGHRQLGLWRGPWQRRNPPRPTKALQDHKTCGTPISSHSSRTRERGVICNNYRGFSLLSVTGKVFAKVILIRLQKLAECVYPEPQCGFRAGRSTTDMVFSLRQLQEKCREQ